MSTARCDGRRVNGTPWCLEHQAPITADSKTDFCDSCGSIVNNRHGAICWRVPVDPSPCAWSE